MKTTLCYPKGMTVRRVSTPEGWFADIPCENTEWIDDSSALITADQERDRCSDGDVICMYGRVVLHRPSEFLLVSCGGLLCRVPSMTYCHDSAIRILVRSGKRLIS